MNVMLSQSPSLSYSRQRERREFFFEDRTPCHADHVGDGLERRTTAAVGLLQSIYGPHEKRLVSQFLSLHRSVLHSFDFILMIQYIECG